MVMCIQWVLDIYYISFHFLFMLANFSPLTFPLISFFPTLPVKGLVYWYPLVYWYLDDLPFIDLSREDLYV